MRSLIALMTLLATPALAGSWDHATGLAELAEESASVAHGVVVAVQTRQGFDGLRTRYTVVVEDTLAGRPLDEVTVELPGGVDGDLRQTVVGVPVWHEGDEVLVFVPWEGRVSLRGIFTVEGDEVIDPAPQRTEPIPSRLGELADALHALRLGRVGR